MNNQYFVYILASKKNGTLYVGVTNNLGRKVVEHKKGLVGGFTKKYGVNTLVYYESTKDIRDALLREKQLKGISRAKKILLIEGFNKDWIDLDPSLRSG